MSKSPWLVTLNGRKQVIDDPNIVTILEAAVKSSVKAERSKMQKIKDVEVIVNNTSDEYIMVHRNNLLELIRVYRIWDTLADAGVDNWEGYDIAMREYYAKYGVEEE